MNLRDFINLLDEKGLLVKLSKPVDVRFEIPTIMKKMDGTPLMFENVKGYDMPVVANICSTRELVALGLGVEQDGILPRLSQGIESPKEPEVVAAQGYKELAPDLSQVPILTYYDFDGGPYVASAIAVAKDEEFGLNASYHRGMKIDDRNFVFRVLKRDLDAYMERGLKEFAYCIGNSIPILLGAAISAGRDVSELAIANALNRTDLIELDGHLVPQSELVIICEVTGELHDEGPFLDLTETPDIVRQQPVMRVKKIFAREDSVFHGLLPGGLEHKVLMGMPREPTIWREVGKVCDVKDVYITPGGTSWLHGAVSIRKKNADDGRKAIEAAFRGHKSMKHVFVVDDDIDVTDPAQIEWAMATRFQAMEVVKDSGERADKDIIVDFSKGSSLDPSSDLDTRMTCKVGFDLTIPWDKDREGFLKPPLPMDIDIEDYK